MKKTAGMQSVTGQGKAMAVSSIGPSRRSAGGYVSEGFALLNDWNITWLYTPSDR
jgi:hypothetical protein